MSDKVEKNGTVELSKEESKLIMQGIRPNDMPFEVFKQIRKEMQKRLKQYKKGEYLHVATHMVPKESIKGQIDKEEIYEALDDFVDIGKGTYIRQEKRKHKPLKRKG